MSSLVVFLYFGGNWDECNKYIDYSVRGAIVPLDCSYDHFEQMIARILDKDGSKHSFKMHYQVFEQGPRIPICDDYSLEFFLVLKNGEKDNRTYPICVDVDALSTSPENLDSSQVPSTRMLTNFTITGPITNNSSVLLPGSPHDFGDLSLGVTANIPTLEEMGLELSEHVTLRGYGDEYEIVDVVTNPTIEEFKKGRTFKNKELVVTSMSLFAITNRFQYKVSKSDFNFYWLKCFKEGCSWNFKSSRTGSNGYFKIRQINNVHTCGMASVLGDHRQATSYVIAACIKHKFLSSRRIYTPGDIMEDMQHSYGVNVSYDKAWRAREIAIKMIRGDPAESYGNLPAYLHRITVANPGTYTKIEADEEGRFLYSFIALGASIAGWKHCKPVIVVDGTFLTSRYRGTLFTASTQDANNNIFILAFGVGDSENNNSWEWFLLRVKEAYGERDDLCIVSDRHGSIAHSVEKVFPNALHGACTYHLLQNLKKEIGKNGKGMREHFNAASRAYTRNEFEIHMRQLDAIDKGIRGYLEGVGLEKWSRAYMTKDRYSVMTSNIAESVNSAIKHSKKYPIEALYECLRCTIQKWFSQNLSDAKSTFTKLATRHDNMLKHRINKSIQLRVHPSTDTIYQVNDESSAYVVDMEQKTCSCRRFQLDHMPCKHAIAVIAKRNYSLEDYCSNFFTKEEYMETYRVPIYALGNREEWDIPDEVKEMTMLAPKTKRSPGRPRENRFKSVLEYKNRARCGKCGGTGHNSRTCRSSEHAANPMRRKRKRQSRSTKEVNQEHEV